MGYARLEVATASAAGLADSCLIDLAHAPLADEGGHVVVGDARADLQRHRLWLDVSTQVRPDYMEVLADQDRNRSTGVQREDRNDSQAIRTF